MATNLQGSAEVLRELRVYERNLYTELGKNLNTQLKPVLGPIQGQINGVITSQLRSRKKAGMFGHDGRTQWGGAEIVTKTSINPKNLIFIEGKGRGSDSLAAHLGLSMRNLQALDAGHQKPFQRDGVQLVRAITHTFKMVRAMALSTCLVNTVVRVGSCGSVC